MSDAEKTIKCLIVDDEPLAQQVIEKYAAQYNELQVVAKCDSAMAAFEALHKHSIDLVFLDINMPVISGLNFLKSLNNPPMVIFTTAYAEYAIEGFELDAVDYLMKPIAPDRFAKAIEKVFLRLDKPISNSNPALAQINSPKEPQKDYVFFKADGKLVKVMFHEILFCEGMKDYLKIHLKSGKYLVIHQTMKNMEELLPASQFMRVHKSYIVSLLAIKSYHDNLLQLIDSTEEVPVSNSYKEELLKKL